MVTVKELMEAYEAGHGDFNALLTTLATHPYAPHRADTDWAEHYARAEEHPDDNDFFWVEAAETAGIITEEQFNAIAAAVDAAQGGEPEA